MKTLVALALALSAAPLHAQWRIASMDLDVVVRPATRTLTVAGTARVTATSGASGAGASGVGAAGAGDLTLAFGPDGVTFDSVRVSPAGRVAFSARRDSVLIRDVRDAALDVTFFAHTERDLGRNQIRDTGAMISWGALWYPAVAWARDSAPEIEFPGTTRITVPARWHTLSPGALVDSAVAGGLRTERWRVTRPTARSFVAAEFVPVTTRVESTTVSVYLLPRHAARGPDYAAAIPRMVRALSSYFGPYPFATFGIAELPREVAPPGFGGRSEPGYFIAHTDALEDDSVDVALFAHELTHMWFPNAVDSRPPGDDMMDEAIASYGVAVYREATLGPRAARRELVEGHPVFGMRGYFHEMRRGADEPLMADYSPFVARAKGPLVYDMLRRRVGDSAFFGVWRDLARRGGSASLTDLRRLYRERAPRDTGLATFLAQWMDRRGAPIVRVTMPPATSSVGVRRVATLVQSDAGGAPPYTVDVPVRLSGPRGVRDTVVHLARRTTTIPIGDATQIDLDPDDRVLLWKPRFGPPPDAPASWPLARWRSWLDGEVPWLMRSYAVRGVRVAVVRDGATLWTARYGDDGAIPPAVTRALVDSLGTRRDTSGVRRLVADGDDVTLAVGDRATGVGVVVTARGGWGGRQLVAHVAQRVAIQYGWRRIPDF